MDTVFEQRRSLILKTFSAIAVALICISFFSHTVSADMGPKSSIEISITNPPSEPYYVSLLIPGTLPEDPYDYYHTYFDVLEDDENIKDKFLNFEADGYVLYSHLAGNYRIYYSEEITDSIHYGGDVPSPVKVMVVTKSGEVKVSNELDTRGFHAEAIYDYSSNTLTEVNYASNFIEDLAIESLFCFGSTLLIEGIVLLCFGLFRKKNLLRFLVANLITQTLLFVFNAAYCIIVPNWSKYFISWLMVEALITVIELLIYFKRFVKKGGTVSVGRNIAYVITANVISAFIDIPIVFIAYLLDLRLLFHR